VYTAPKAGIEDAEKKFRPRRPYEEPSQAVKDKLRKTMEEVAAFEEATAEETS
jgi:4-hydroxy-2-oxoglutarate aldolase